MDMQQKVFTLEEANKEVQKLSELFSIIFRLRDRANALSKDIEVFLDIWGEAVKEQSNQDNKFYLDRVEKRSRLMAEIKEMVDEIQNTGCIVKNIDQGLVDFMHDDGEALVCLCWKYGEDSVKHWHGIQAGYVGRRPIEELAIRKQQ